LAVASKAERKQSIQKWVRWLAVAVPVAAVIIYLLIWYGPDVIARHDIGNVTGPLRVLRLQQARDAARGRLLTLGAGLFAAGALIFTGRNYGLARRTYQLTEEGQVTDRYTKAIEQLGSDKLDVRIGGIYALERIARDSVRDHPTVMDVLAAFTREHSREPWPPDAGANVPRAPDAGANVPRPDVQAAATVIGRRNPTHDRGRIDLTGADLAGADLTGANFTGVVLTGVNLIGAYLTHADLTGADLVMADLSYANLDDVDFTAADLRDVDLADATLTGADLRGVDLTGAGLIGASLDGAALTGAQLLGATFSENVTPPEGWVRDSNSGRLARASAEADDSGN
jgi:pentapeptide repeat protein